MSTTNDNLMVACGQEGFAQVDVFLSSSNQSQSTARPISAAVTRVLASPVSGNGSLIMRSIGSGEASNPMAFVLNDSPNTIKVFPAVGENQGGVANASLCIPSGQSGFLFKTATTQKGGGTAATLDWRSAVVP